MTTKIIVIKNYQTIILFILGGLFLFFNNCFAKIEITEIMYDLPGSDAPTGQGNREWAEIYNSGEETIDLIGGTKGWKFNDGSNHNFVSISDGDLILSAGQYAVLADNIASFLTDHPGFAGKIIDTAMSLKNTVATLSILDPDVNLIDSVAYSTDQGANGNGKTLEKNSQGQWQESAIDGGTPGTTNSLQQTADSTPPTADGQQPTANGQQQATTDDHLPSTVDSQSPTGETEYKKYSDKIYINEFIPNPIDNDTDNEWIELINLDSEIIDLSDWQISDSATSTKPFTIPETTLIQPDELLLFQRPQTKIALNNNGDTVKLFYPNADLAQEINYTDSQEGWSVAREKNEDYAWTSESTPKAANIIKQEIKKTTAPLPKKSSIAPVPTTPETNTQQTPNLTSNSITVIVPNESNDDENQTIAAVNPVPLDETPTMANDQSMRNQASLANITNDILAQSPANSQLSPDPEQLTAPINNSVESGTKNHISTWGKTIALAILIAGFGAITLVNIRRRLH